MPRSRPWSASRSLWGSSLPAGPAALSVGGARPAVACLWCRCGVSCGVGPAFAEIAPAAPTPCVCVCATPRSLWGASCGSAPSVGRILPEHAFGAGVSSAAGASRVRRMRPAGERLLQGGPKFAGRILPVLSPVARARAPCVRAHVRIPGLVRPRALGSRQVPQALRTSQARPPPRTRPINADFASWETNSALIGRSLARRASSATSPTGRGAP